MDSILAAGVRGMVVDRIVVDEFRQPPFSSHYAMEQGEALVFDGLLKWVVDQGSTLGPKRVGSMSVDDAVIPEYIEPEPDTRLVVAEATRAAIRKFLASSDVIEGKVVPLDASASILSPAHPMHPSRIQS